ncbi:MAG TPA: hypothetical protein VGB14_13370 [Acidimicrobiales bacterium]
MSLVHKLSEAKRLMDEARSAPFADLAVIHAALRDVIDAAEEEAAEVEGLAEAHG